jgi:hypothetical protein
VLVSITYMLVSIAYALVKNDIFVGEYSICVG